MRNLKTQTTKTTIKTYHEYIFDDMICPNEIISLSYSTIWSSSLEYSSPVFLSFSGIRSIYFDNKSNTGIF